MNQKALQTAARAYLEVDSKMNNDPKNGVSVRHDSLKSAIAAYHAALSENAPELVKMARAQAIEIAREGILGTGNLLTALADTIEALHDRIQYVQFQHADLMIENAALRTPHEDMVLVPRERLISKHGDKDQFRKCDICHANWPEWQTPEHQGECPLATHKERDDE